MKTISLLFFICTILLIHVSQGFLNLSRFQISGRKEPSIVTVCQYKATNNNNNNNNNNHDNNNNNNNNNDLVNDDTKNNHSKNNNHRMINHLKKVLIMATFIPALTFADSQIPTTTKSLESAIVTLEQSKDRDTTLQALDSLYSTAQTKSSILKTKYKYRIVNALKEKRSEFNEKWDASLGIASEEVRRRIDPYHTVDIADYLKIAPIVGGVCYLGALVIQNTIPELFLFAYPTAVGVFLLPIIVKVFGG